MTNNVEVIDIFRPFFIRNKDREKLISILKENRESWISLNTCHNTIEIRYLKEKRYKKIDGVLFNGVFTNQNIDKTELDWFGASFEALDALFDKYKDNKTVLHKLAIFCLRSKSKVYWRLKLKDTQLATDIMAEVLGSEID